jgi:hypothetical protein
VLDPVRHAHHLAGAPGAGRNGRLLQEITTRLPGRVDGAATPFTSANDLMHAPRRAAAAHGEHENHTGHYDKNWPEWYAAYIVAEQTGAELPS